MRERTNRRTATSTGLRALAAAAVVAVGAAGVVAAVSSSSQAAPTDALFVSPTGIDSAAGTEAAPTTLVSAISRVTPGGTIYLRGGMYSYSSTVTIADGNDGTPLARKSITAYPGETPVLNFAAQAEDPANRGVVLVGDYWTLSGLVVEHAGDNGIYVSGSNNIIERAVTRFNRDTGLQLGRASATTPKEQWPSNNLVQLSESHDNRDVTGENADGFAAKLTVGPGNVFRYDVAHHNSDDGWDLFAKPETGPIAPVTIEDSLAYSNGTLTDGSSLANGDGNGFKLGGAKIAVDHVIRRSVAYKNKQHGFTWNSNPGKITVTDNLSIDNAQRNYAFDGGVSVFSNDVSCRFSGSTADKISGSADSSVQFWNGRNGAGCASLNGPLTWSFTAVAGNAKTLANAGEGATSSGALRVTVGAVQVAPVGGAPAPDPAPAPAPDPAPAPAPAPAPGPAGGSPTDVAPPPTTTFSDAFDDGDQAGWTVAKGSWAVTGQAFRPTAKGAAVALVTATNLTATDVKVAVTRAGSTGSVAVIARAGDAKNYYALTVRGSNRVELRKVVAGRSTVLDTVRFATVPDAAYTLRLVVNGTGLTGFVGDTEVVSATDGTFGSGTVGVGTNNATASFDDVVVAAP